MKAGILTFHGANNYGAVLQAYALTEWLKQHQVEPEIINYRSRVYSKYKVFRCRLYKAHPYMFAVDFFKCPGKIKRNRNFDYFRNHYLPVSNKEYHTEKDLKETEKTKDCFICGSDQIWNPELTKGFDPAYFLSFIDDKKKKQSYAPSVALNSLNDFQKAQIIEYISEFNSVSIREQEMIDILQPYCQEHIFKACDPVFLPDKECFERICSNKYENRRYIFLYVVGRAKNFKNVIAYAERKAKEKGIQLYYLIDGDKSFYHIHGKNVFGCKPNDFLSLIKNAEYVICNSFHASAFSILFQKQFVTFLKAATGTRMVNLLRDFNLLDRICDDTGKTDVFSTVIDYRQADQQLAEYRKESEEYLLCALGIHEKNTGRDEEAYSAAKKKQEQLFGFVNWRKKCYLARHRNQETVAGSRSGGVFIAISDAILASGGVVYGCKMENPDTAIHFRASTQEERDQFRGSKYIQSEMRKCYRQIRDDLKRGLPVLFSGTGCQVAGLYGFLQGENTEKLFTVDIICHGVASQRVWKEYLKWEEHKMGKKITSVNFRDKRYGWKAHLETFNMEGKTKASSVFRVLFLRNAFLRPCCYECKFARLSRKSDLTIGDAWGIEEKESLLNDNKGCSIVLVNSNKGEEIFKRCQANLIIEEENLEGYLQPNLYKPSNKPENRQKQWECLEKKGFDMLARRYGKAGPIRRMKDNKLIALDKLRNMHQHRLHIS